jgi:hypothetical protein
MKITRFLSAASCFVLASLFFFASPARAQNAPAATCCKSDLQIVATSPVELLVTAPNGLKTGFNPTTGLHLQQIPSSSYYAAPIPVASGGTVEGRRIDINMPAAGEYRVQAIGQETRAFDVQFIAVDNNGGRSEMKFAAGASPNATFVYDVRYSPAPGSKIRVKPLVPFASLAADVDVSAGPPPKFSASGSVTLGPGAGVSDPATEPFSFHLAGYSVTIPSGSFKRSKAGDYAFNGTIAGVPLRVRIVPESGNSFDFRVETRNIDMTHAINPLRLLLILGDNAGSDVINAVTK